MASCLRPRASPDSLILPGHWAKGPWSCRPGAKGTCRPGPGQLSTALARACGISINDFEILLRLDHVPPPGLRLGELTPAVQLTQPSLSRTVARLGRRGWLSRSGALDDRRGVLVAITPAGQEVLRRAAGVHAQTIREFLLDPLTPREQDLLARALTRIAAN